MIDRLSGGTFMKTSLHLLQDFDLIIALVIIIVLIIYAFFQARKARNIFHMVGNKISQVAINFSANYGLLMNTITADFDDSYYINSLEIQKITYARRYSTKIVAITKLPVELILDAYIKSFCTTIRKKLRSESLSSVITCCYYFKTNNEALLEEAFLIFLYLSCLDH